MESPLVTKNDLKSSDSNDDIQRRRFVLDLLITYAYCLMLTIGFVAFEFFGTFLHYGLVRPVWAYILGGTTAVILVVYLVSSLVQLSNPKWRRRSLQKRTVFMRTVIAVSSWIILFSSVTFFPFRAQALKNDTTNIVPGFGIGFYFAVMFIVVFGFISVLVFSRVKEAQSKQ